MRARMSAVRTFLADDAGQDLAEYGIALAIIALGAAAAAVVVAGDVRTLWESARDAIADVVS